LKKLTKLLVQHEVTISQVVTLQKCFVKDKSFVEKVPLKDISDAIQRVISKEDVAEKMMEFLVSRSAESNEEEVLYSRVINLVDSLKLQTLQKNCKPGFNLDNKAKTKMVSTKPPQKSEEGEIHALLEYVWRKIHEKHKNLINAFRFFDDKAKGKIKKQDFCVRLEKMKILLSKADSDKIFNFLDKSNSGSLNFS
jgi:Ca2+-binding EF-hand superfamily protein